MNIRILFLTASLLIAGCGRQRNDPETLAINAVQGRNPEFVMDTPKGKLFRIMVDMGENQWHDRVYFFTNTTETLNVNNTVSSGKTTYHTTTVVIDGVEYIRK